MPTNRKKETIKSAECPVTEYLKNSELPQNHPRLGRTQVIKREIIKKTLEIYTT